MSDPTVAKAPAGTKSAQPTAFDLKKLSAMYDFTGQTIVITGGTGILGSDICCALAGCGAQLAVLDLNLEPGKALLERLGPRAKQVELFACNVLNTENLTSVAADVLKRFGKIDA